jgi:hypothetical protein
MKRFLQNAAVAIGAAALLAIGGCSGGGEATKQAPKQPAAPAEPVTGQTALFEIYKVARTWAPDLQILELKSMLLEDKKTEPGKAYAWTAVFYSPTKNVARTFVYSVEEISQTLHKGVRAGSDETYNPLTARTKPFLINAVKIDTPAALKTAMEKGKQYATAHANLPIIMILDRRPEFDDPAWRIVWGASLGVSNYSIYINASSGEYLQTMR